MAKILRYQQDALASQLVGVPSVDTSAAGLASTIGGAAAGIQSAQNQLQYQQSARNAMLAANSFQQVEGELRQRNAEAKAAQAHKQALQNDITAAWHTDRLERKHAEYIAALKDATKNNVDGIAEEYQKNADKMIRDYAYENNLQANPDVYAKVIGNWMTMDKAANKDIYNYKETQGINIAKAQVAELNRNAADDMGNATDLATLKAQMKKYGANAERNLVAYGDQGWVKADETVAKGVKSFLVNAALRNPSSVRRGADGNAEMVPGEAISAMSDPDLYRYIDGDLRNHIQNLDESTRKQKEQDQQLLANYNSQYAISSANDAVRNAMSSPADAANVLAGLTQTYDSIPSTKEYAHIKEHILGAMKTVSGIGDSDRNFKYTSAKDAVVIDNAIAMAPLIDAQTKMAVMKLDKAQRYTSPESVKTRGDLRAGITALMTSLKAEKKHDNAHFAELNRLNTGVLKAFNEGQISESDLEQHTKALSVALEMMAPGPVKNITPNFVLDYIYSTRSKPSDELMNAFKAYNPDLAKNPKHAEDVIQRLVDREAANIQAQAAQKNISGADLGRIKRLAERNAYRKLLRLRGADLQPYIPSMQAPERKVFTQPKPNKLVPPPPPVMVPPPPPGVPTQDQLNQYQ